MSSDTATTATQSVRSSILDTDDVDCEEDVRTLDSDQFYAHLTTRNRGLIAAEDQHAIRRARVLIAGCGSIGGAAVEPLVRIGFERLHLADNGTYELNNLNRQRAGLADLGLNKATVAARNARAINPHATVTVSDTGVTEDNAHALAAAADLIIDGVDVTTRSGLRAKVALHQAALVHRKPLITGWDLAGVLCAQHIDYRRTNLIFNGALTASEADALSVWEAIFRIAPMSRMPSEMLHELACNINRDDYSVPQLPEAAWQFGSLSCAMAARVVAGHKVPKLASVDVHRVTGTRIDRVRDTLARPVRWAQFAHALGARSIVRSTMPTPLLTATRQWTDS